MRAIVTRADQKSTGSPLLPFAICAAITLGLFIAGALASALRYQRLREVEITALRLTRLEGMILRLDETLTMSARMAAATGDMRWEQRYRQSEAPLDRALHEAMSIAPEAAHDAAQAMDLANASLVAKEGHAFELVRQGKLGDAMAVFDGSYDELKQRYASGMRDIMTAVDEAVASQLSDHRRTMLETVVFALGALALLLALWLRMLAMIRRYIRERRSAEDELRAARATLESRVEERTREVAASREQYRSLIENIEAIPFEWDPGAHRMVYIAPQAGKLLGHPIEALQGAGFVATVLPEDERARLAPQIEQFLAGEPGGALDVRMVTAAGRTVHVRILLGARAQGRNACGVMLDMTKQRQLESELHQAHKLESVGRLASGIAHEINTPVQFVTDSVQFVRDSLADVMTVLDRHRLSTERVAAGEPSVELARAAQAAEADADLAYLADNVPKALDRALDGLTRVAAIVRSMKVFAHPDRKTKTRIDLNESIASTLTIARNEYKYVADLETQYGELPAVACFPGELNQVVLNLVINAAHAIGDVVTGTDQRGRITVTTRQDGGDAVIAISDTGTGIPPAVQARLFEPFFTTKEIGKGTGQGLSHARAVVVDRHGGSLTYETEVGVGTTFTVRIPIDSCTGGEDELAA